MMKASSCLYDPNAKLAYSMGNENFSSVKVSYIPCLVEKPEGV